MHRAVRACAGQRPFRLSSHLIHTRAEPAGSAATVTALPSNPGGEPMLGRMRSHLTYSNVIATVALFCALGGSAYAAKKISGKQIINRTIDRQEDQTGALGVDRDQRAAAWRQEVPGPACVDAGKLSGVPLAVDRDGTLGLRRRRQLRSERHQLRHLRQRFAQPAALRPRDAGRHRRRRDRQHTRRSRPPAGSQVDGADVGGSAQSAGDDVFSHFNGEDAGLATTAVTGDLAAGAHTFALCLQRRTIPTPRSTRAKISAILAGSG